MYITLDILQKRGACQEALDFFARRCPDGVEMIYAIEKMHLPEHFLHWGYEHLDPGPEEVAAYWKKVGVTQSEGVYSSSKVTNSAIVASSQIVSDSAFVFNSKNVNNSEQINDSSFVDNSSYVVNSFFVSGSRLIVKGTNITDCDRVYKSTYIGNSKGVFESTNILNCIAIWKSDNLTDCGFCFDCKNLKNALFCNQKTDGEYLLFNKTIDPARFDMILRQFNKFDIELQLTSAWEGKDTPIPHYDYRKHLTRIPEVFWQWARSLPNFDAEIMYSLTFDPQFLQ